MPYLVADIRSELRDDRVERGIVDGERAVNVVAGVGRMPLSGCVRRAGV